MECLECTPELRPLLDWLNALDRLAPCPAELLPADVRTAMENMLGQAENYIAVGGKWHGPYGPPDHIMIYRRGGDFEPLLGMTEAEAAQWHMADL
jgi:hypothetical protein